MSLSFTPNSSRSGQRILGVVIGPRGPSSTIVIGDVTTVAPGAPATVTNVGTETAAIFDFGIPQGDQGIQGPAASVAVGVVNTLPPGSLATVTNVGTSSAAIFDFGIPEGDPGEMTGPVSSVDGQAAVFDGVGGTAVKAFTATGIVKAASGVLSAATAGTDYVGPSTTLTAGSGLTGGGDLSANRTINVGAGTGITVNADDVAIASAYQAVGKQPIYIPAAAMVARTTNGAAPGATEMTTNKQMVKTLDFDTSTQEFAQFSIRMPKSWNEGTVTFVPVWSHASTTTNFGVVWALEAVAISNDDTLDAAWGTAGTSTDTGGTTNDLYEGPESSAITIGGTPAEGDTVYFQVKRNVSDGSDTMAVDARLHGVLLYITTNAANDA